ncbi:hypothetical protein TTY48_27060 [Tsukamurella sp. TY48]|nr:hypothetical protein TTY48_27060 [Tsukamurella sp. TY48]
MRPTVGLLRSKPSCEAVAPQGFRTVRTYPYRFGEVRRTCSRTTGNLSSVEKLPVRVESSPSPTPSPPHASASPMQVHGGGRGITGRRAPGGERAAGYF